MDKLTGVIAFVRTADLGSFVAAGRVYLNSPLSQVRPLAHSRGMVASSPTAGWSGNVSR